MIDFSMYSINSFSPGEFLQGHRDTGAAAESAYSAGWSFREYLASLTSESETYRANSFDSISGQTYEQYTPVNVVNGEDRQYGSTKSPADTASVAADRTETALDDRSEINGKSPAETDKGESGAARVTENRKADESTYSKNDKGNSGDSAKKIEENQLETSGSPEAAAHNNIQSSRQKTQNRTGKAGSENADEKMSVKRESIQNEPASSAAAEHDTLKTAGHMPDAAAGLADSIAGAANNSISKNSTTKDGTTKNGTQDIGASRNMIAGNRQDSRGVQGQKISGQQKAEIRVIDARTDSDKAAGNGSNVASSGRNSSQEFQLQMNQGGDSGQSNLQDEQNSGQQSMQVFIRSEGSEDLQVPLSRSTADTDVRSQLAQQLREQLNGEIVKRGSIVLKNNGSGEIKLDLKPDHLGQVKIRLSMENNNIAGRILVENINVKEVFDQNLQELYRAFREHGFNETALNVSVGDQRRERKSGGDGNGQSVADMSSVRMGDIEQLRFMQPGIEDRLIDVMA